VDAFVEWIENLDHRPNTVIGEPQLKQACLREDNLQAKCSARDLEEDE
jgi:hypothetical protein